MIPCEVIGTRSRKAGSQLQLVEVIVVPLNVVVYPDGLTKDTPAGDWVNTYTTGNPTFFPIANNCLEATLCSVL